MAEVFAGKPAERQNPAYRSAVFLVSASAPCWPRRKHPFESIAYFLAHQDHGVHIGLLAIVFGKTFALGIGENQAAGFERPAAAVGNKNIGAGTFDDTVGLKNNFAVAVEIVGNIGVELAGFGFTQPTAFQVNGWQMERYAQE